MEVISFMELQGRVLFKQMNNSVFSESRTDYSQKLRSVDFWNGKQRNGEKDLGRIKTFKIIHEATNQQTTDNLKL